MQHPDFGNGYFLSTNNHSLHTNSKKYNIKISVQKLYRQKMLSKKAQNKEKKEIILFVHGACHGAWVWEKYFMDFFAQNGYSNYAFDFRKHEIPGKIKKINSLSIADYVEDLTNAVNSLEQEPILIGHSMGGFIVQKYLEKNSCKKVILLNSVPSKGIFFSTLKFLKKPYTISSLLQLNIYGIINNAKKAKWAVFSDSLNNKEVEEYSKQMCSESMKAFIQILFIRIKINYHIKTPMLVVASENDRIISVRASKKTAEKYLSDFILIADIAHDSMLDTNHSVVAEEIIKWIER